MLGRKHRDPGKRARLPAALRSVHAMDLGLQGRSAVITGGSKGIGFAIATEFAREGVNLHLAARSSDDLKRAASDLISRFGVRVETHAVDLSDRMRRDAFARECADVDILVNCAGAIPGGALDQVSEEAWRAAWDLKLFGYIGVTRVILGPWVTTARQRSRFEEERAAMKNAGSNLPGSSCSRSTAAPDAPA